MKFYPSQLNVLFDKIKRGQITSILLFGPDKGYISTICQIIIKQLDLVTTSLPYNEATSESLNVLLNSKNFFNKREFIKITSVTSAINANLKTLLSTEFPNFIAFIADELPATSGIRTFFEKHESLASVSCYSDDEQSVARIIQKKCELAGKVIDQDALLYLASCLKGDHQLVNHEIDKLLSYVFDKRVITLQDTMRVIVDDLNASGDDLCTYFAEKDTHKMLIEIDKLSTQGINPVLMIRALIRYYLNLYIVLSKVEEGEGVDNAMKSLSPPIFYKRVNNFKKIVSSAVLADIMKVLANLQDAEVSFKSEPKGFDLLKIMLTN